MNTVELLKKILIFLKLKHSRAYQEEAPDDAQFPYVTFEISNSFPIESAEFVNLIVDVWDISKDTTAIEQLADAIDGDGDKVNPTGLNRTSLSSDGIFLGKVYRESRFKVPDEDKRIQRRQLRYTINANF